MRSTRLATAGASAVASHPTPIICFAAQGARRRKRTGSGGRHGWARSDVPAAQRLSSASTGRLQQRITTSWRCKRDARAGQELRAGALPQDKGSTQTGGSNEAPPSLSVALSGLERRVRTASNGPARHGFFIGTLGFSTYAVLDDGTVMTFMTTPDKPKLLTPTL